jgi:hypothetical protein
MTATIANETYFVSPELFQKATEDFDAEYAGRYDHITSKESLDMLACQDSGRKAEHVVYHALSSLGYEVELLNGRESCDLLIYHKGKRVGVEVKSARQSGASNNYNFHGINNESSITIMLFITEMGLELRVADTYCMCDWAEEHYTYTTDGKKPGYSINFNGKTRLNRHQDGPRDIFRPLCRKSVDWALS